MNLDDCVIIVTGAAGGVGRSVTEGLLAAGARVAAGDANAAGLRDLRRALDVDPSRFFSAALDVTDEDSVESFLDQAQLSLGAADGLINCAGILRDGLLVQKDADGVRTMTLAQWRAVLDVNLSGPFLVTRGWARRLLERHDPADGNGGGVVVNVSSVMSRGNPGQANYSASKAGLDAATRAWARELAPYGIRVAALAPGVVSTPFLDGIAEAAVERLVRATPLRRSGSLDELWLALRFVLECDFFTGRVLQLDGGLEVD